MTTTTTTRHALPGLRPEPLASYLAGLGLIRVLGEQADPGARAAWTPDGLAIATKVPDIASALLRGVPENPAVLTGSTSSGRCPAGSTPKPHNRQNPAQSAQL